MQEKPGIRAGPRGYRERWMTVAWWLTVCLLAWSGCAQHCLAADSKPAKNVVILYSFSKRDVFDPQSLESAIRSRVSEPVNFYVEYLESQRFENTDYRKRIGESLRAVYAQQTLAVVSVVAYPALEFALEFRDQLFPGVPIVFAWVAPGRIEGRRRWPGVTGVTFPVDAKGTVDLALRLSPGTKNVAVVAGSSEFEQYSLALTHHGLGLHRNELNVIDLVGLPTEQLLQEVSKLPPHTIVFFQLIPQESSQQAIGTYDILAAISQQFPSYCIHNYCLDHGAIEGIRQIFGEQVQRASEVAARVLAGESAESIPVVHATHVYPEVDWRELRRWNMSESALPPGTIVRFGSRRSGNATRSILSRESP